MINKFLTLSVGALCVLSCSDSDPVMEDMTGTDNAGEYQPVQIEEYREKMRTQPYPTAVSTIFVNPAPLIVPQSMKTGRSIQFQLSDSRDFTSELTEMSEANEWCIYSPHRYLKPGTWYWRFRNVGYGNEISDWSKVMSFTVTGEEDRFVTPAFEVFLQRIPRTHPRLHCYMSANLENARAKVTSHPEYRELISRANIGLRLNEGDVASLYRSSDDLRVGVMYLHDAYTLTQDARYRDKMQAILEAIVSTPATDSQLFGDNFATTAIAYAYAVITDALYDNINVTVRNGALQQLDRILTRMMTSCYGYQENHIFDNHFWQRNMRIIFQSALVLFDQPGYSAQATKALEYLYELWCTRAPAGGFTRDGLWPNGVGYMSANVLTLSYMPLYLGYVTGFDFLSHPWYRAAGKSLSYSCPTGSMGVGFGDQSEKYTTTNRQYPAFADFLAAEMGDSFASWYATENKSLLHTDYEMRLYRMTRTADYNCVQPQHISRLMVYPDAGEVTMHSDITDTDSDLALAFRSSTFGSGSHTTSSQNAFNLYYAGSPVFHSSGYYQNFSDAHNLMSYRHSRAHNTILINGIGQPYSTRAYGRILRAGGGEAISYALGDASDAYCGVTNDAMWLSAFDKAGISQTPENGFGKTPLTKYKRHIAMLEGGVVVIYDELEASENASWDWLLHSDTEMKIDHGKMSLDVESERSHSRVLLMSDAGLQLSQTDEFVVAPAIQGPQYPNQWHFTARAGNVRRLRICAVIQTRRPGVAFLPTTNNYDGSVTISNWTIMPQLNPDAEPELLIVDNDGRNALSYGSGSFSIGGKTYDHTRGGSTVIVSNGKAEELQEIVQASSRSL